MASLNMSLFYVFTHSFTLWPDAYDCPEGLDQSEEKWPILGSYLIVSGIVFLILYLPSFFVIIRFKSRTPAFQLMLILVVFDFTNLIINSLITGILALTGTSFCQYPRFFFIVGAIAVGAWFGDCLACVLLAIERCVEVNSNFLFAFIFGRRVFYFVTIILIVYAIYGMVFTVPVIFTPEFGSYFYDPMVGKDPKMYHNLSHAFNNSSVAVLTTLLYFYLCSYLIFKFGYSTSMWLYKSKRQIILQGVVLCFFHGVTGIIHAYMQYFYSPSWMIVLAQIVWQWSNGCLSIVYLTLNRTVRNAVIKMLIPKKIRLRHGWHIGADEHVALEKAVNNATSGVNAVACTVGIKFNNYFQN